MMNQKNHFGFKVYMPHCQNAYFKMSKSKKKTFVYIRIFYAFKQSYGKSIFYGHAFQLQYGIICFFAMCANIKCLNIHVKFMLEPVTMISRASPTAAETENASGSYSSGATQSDRAVCCDANLAQICVKFASPWLRRVSA
jgi:hypothetical protein